MHLILFKCHPKVEENCLRSFETSRSHSCQRSKSWLERAFHNQN